MRTLSEEEITEEVEFLTRDAHWPLWPILPVKHIHRHEEGHPKDEELGIMIAGQGPKIYLKHLYEMEGDKTIGEQLQGVRFLEFDSLEDLVKAGWVGD